MTEDDQVDSYMNLILDSCRLLNLQPTHSLIIEIGQIMKELVNQDIEPNIENIISKYNKTELN